MISRLLALIGAIGLTQSFAKTLSNPGFPIAFPYEKGYFSLMGSKPEMFLPGVAGG